MEIQGKYVKNMRKYKGTIIVLIVCMIFAYLYAHVDKNPGNRRRIKKRIFLQNP